jgi:hypothetical protein
VRPPFFPSSPAYLNLVLCQLPFPTVDMADMGSDFPCALRCDSNERNNNNVTTETFGTLHGWRIDR